MKLYVLVLVLLFLVYIGSALGFLMQADTVPMLKKTRRYCMGVPIITFACTVSMMIRQIKKRDFKKACSIVFMGGKMAVIGMAMARREELREKQTQTQTIRDKKTVGMKKEIMKMVEIIKTIKQFLNDFYTDGKGLILN